MEEKRVVLNEKSQEIYDDPSLTQYIIPFPYQKAADISCGYQYEAGTPELRYVKTVWLEKGVDFTVSPPKPDLLQTQWGTLDMLVTLPPNAESVIIRRQTTFTQEVSLPNGMRIVGKTLEGMTDKATMEAQELQEQSISQDDYNAMIEAYGQAFQALTDRIDDWKQDKRPDSLNTIFDELNLIRDLYIPPKYVKTVENREVDETRNVDVITYLTQAEFDALPRPIPQGMYCVTDGDMKDEIDLLIDSRIDVHNENPQAHPAVRDSVENVRRTADSAIQPSDVVNNLDSGGASLPLSAEMGKSLKARIQALGIVGARSRGVVHYALESAEDTFRIGAIAVLEPGEGYQAGDALFLSGEGLFIPALIIVEAVDTDGMIETIYVSNMGSFSVDPGGLNIPMKGGHGHGATFNIMTILGPSTTLADIFLPHTADTAVVLQDETRGGDTWSWIYADYNGDGVNNWVPDHKIDSNLRDFTVYPIQADELAGDAVTDAKIGTRPLQDDDASPSLISIAAKTFTHWLQGIRDNLKYLFASAIFKAESATGFLWNDGSSGFPSAADVGLGNVNNTSDVNKPVSTAQTEAIMSRVAVEASIRQQQLQIEAEERRLEEIQLRSEILDEAKTRAGADTALQNADLLLSRRISEEAETRESEAGAEAAAREEADKELQKNIEDEASARAIAIGIEREERKADDRAEAAAREEADDELRAAVDAEAEARASADTALQAEAESRVSKAIFDDSNNALVSDMAITPHRSALAFIRKTLKNVDTGENFYMDLHIYSEDLSLISRIERMDEHLYRMGLDIRDRGVTAAKLADGAVTSGKIAESPHLTGTPTAPTAEAGTSDTQIATTAFVGAAVEAEAGARDEAIAEAKLSIQTWLAAVETKADLPDPATLDHSTSYLCRVINDADTPANNGVWQLISGAADWTYFSDNLDFVDETELQAAIAVEAEARVSGDSVSESNLTTAVLSITRVMTTERNERVSGDSALQSAIDAETDARTEAVKAAVTTTLADEDASATPPSAGIALTFVALFQTVRNNLKYLFNNVVYKVTASAGFLKNDGTVGCPSKADVGLGNVDNTSDADKPVSTAQAEAIAAAADAAAAAQSTADNAVSAVNMETDARESLQTDLADEATARAEAVSAEAEARAEAFLDLHSQILDIEDRAVHRATAETISGVKTFSAAPLMTASAFAANSLAALNANKSLLSLPQGDAGNALVSNGPGNLPSFQPIISSGGDSRIARVNIPALAMTSKDVQVSIPKNIDEVLSGFFVDFILNQNWWIPFIMAEVLDEEVIFHIDGNPGGSTYANALRINAVFYTGGLEYTTVESVLPGYAASQIVETAATQTIPAGTVFQGFYLAQNQATGNWFIPYVIADQRTAGVVKFKLIGNPGGVLSANRMKIVGLYKKL